MLGLKWSAGRQRRTDAQSKPSASTSPSLTAGFLPVFTGDELLRVKARQQLLRQLQENCPLSSSRFEAWWVMPAQLLAENVQLLPARWSGPFSGSGGFLDQSLTSAVQAVRLARGMMLPRGAAPEEQAEQHAGWLCAVYWAALCHHLHWLSAVEGEEHSGGIWYPGMHVPQDAWRVKVRESGARGVLNPVFIAGRLLPDEGIIWLQRWPEIAEALLAFLEGDERSVICGIISDAVKQYGLHDISLYHRVLQEKPSLQRKDFSSLSNNNNVSKYSDSIADEQFSYDVTHPTSLPPDEVSALPDQIPLVSAFDCPDIQKDSTEDSTSESVVPLPADDFFAEPEQKISLIPHGPNNHEPSGELFWEWLRNAIHDGTLTINKHDSIAHVVARFVFVSSPDCFFKYIATVCNVTTDKALLQKGFEALNIHYSQNGKGLFHCHKYGSPEKRGRYTKMSGYLIASDIIFERGHCPPGSDFLSPGN
ncbi:MAG TPA: TraI domain-containing protein [Scandinavium sp.]|jgi:integrating conjugative element relaxase (TIGR03760 family)